MSRAGGGGAGIVLRALRAAIVKDARLLLRDKVGLVFLTIAPLIVMSVAGFSLSTLFGGAPQGDARYVLPIADEDGGRVARAFREGLGEDGGIELRDMASRDEAIALVRDRQAGAALVVPPGTMAALAHGRDATLELFTDPVKFVEVANVRYAVQELRNRLGQEALATAQRRVERVRAKVAAAQGRIERRVKSLEKQLASSEGRARDGIARLERDVEATRKRVTAELRRAIDAATVQEAAAARSRAERELGRELAPVRSFLDQLTAYRTSFEAWIARAREAAGSYADRIPPPPEPPALPPELQTLANADTAAIAARVIEGGTPPTIALPKIDIAVPPLPALPEIAVPPLRALPELRLPRLPGIDEASVTGAPKVLNSFDQYVPGFSITFLMLGMLIGVAMTLIDELELGTLERIRATPAPMWTLIVGKLLVRFTIGVMQMVVLLAVGHFAFGVSVGPQPAALLLPSAGIVFVGTAFGVLVAGLAPTRDAVMPLGAIAIVTMCAVGGCWWPIDLEPRWMRDVAQWFPTTWAMSGFKDLMMRRQTVGAALEPTAILVVFGMVFLVSGLVLFRWRR
jgi:ABC-type multidrug transport system permease subunit